MSHHEEPAKPARPRRYPLRSAALATVVGLAGVVGCLNYIRFVPDLTRAESLVAGSVLLSSVVLATFGLLVLLITGVSTATFDRLEACRLARSEPTVKEPDALTDSELLCLRYLELHPLYAPSEEPWPELDGLVARGMLQITHVSDMMRAYESTVAGRATCHAIVKHKRESVS